MPLEAISVDLAADVPGDLPLDPLPRLPVGGRRDRYVRGSLPLRILDQHDD
jgi:hypothetical protein